MTSITSGPGATGTKWNGPSIADKYKTLQDIKKSADLASETAKTTEYELPQISAAATKSYEAMSEPYVRGTGPFAIRWNSMSAADQDKRLERMSKYGEVTVEEARAIIDAQIRGEDYAAEYAQRQASPAAAKAYEEMRTNALGASALAKWDKMSATEQEPYLYKTPRAGTPGRVYIPPADFKPDEEIVTMLATAEKLRIGVPVKLNFKSAPAGATYERPNLAPFKVYEEGNKPYQGAEVHSASAQNVNDVLKYAAAGGYSVDDYIGSVRSDIARSAKDTVFTAAWGNDRITNSVDEYAGWIKEAEAAYAAAAASKYEQVAAA